MNSTKCKSCGIVNLSTDLHCRRCGHVLFASSSSYNVQSPRMAAKRGFPFFSIILVAAAIGIFAYMYMGIKNEMNEVQTSEANRIATQAKQPDIGLSRSEADKKRAGQYGNTIQNSAALAESKKRLEETQKLMQPANSSPRP